MYGHIIKTVINIFPTPSTAPSSTPSVSQYSTPLLALYSTYTKANIVILCQPCSTEQQPKETVDGLIVNNIKKFLNNNKKGGPDTYVNKVMKSAILQACTFTTPTSGIDGIRHRLGLTKDLFFWFLEK